MPYLLGIPLIFDVFRRELDCPQPNIDAIGPKCDVPSSSSEISAPCDDHVDCSAPLRQMTMIGTRCPDGLALPLTPQNEGDNAPNHALNFTRDDHLLTMIDLVLGRDSSFVPPSDCRPSQVLANRSILAKEGHRSRLTWLKFFRVNFLSHINSC